MSLTPLIELRDICYRYPGQTTPILHHLDLAVTEEKIGLIGPNGSGKTTLFHILVGLRSPDSGTILFKDETITQKTGFQQLRKEVGFLFQNSDDQLFSPTVLEDVAFGPLNLGLSPEEARQVATATLNELGLTGFEDRVTHKLSGGEKKLVALATILSMRPRVLLLDEPTNNLDPQTRSRLIHILKNLQQAQIIISHDLDFLADTTSTLYTIDQGQLHLCTEDHIHAHKHVHVYGDKPHHHT